VYARTCLPVPKVKKNDGAFDPVFVISFKLD